MTGSSAWIGADVDADAGGEVVIGGVVVAGVDAAGVLGSGVSGVVAGVRSSSVFGEVEEVVVEAATVVVV